MQKLLLRRGKMGKKIRPPLTWIPGSAPASNTIVNKRYLITKKTINKKYPTMLQQKIWSYSIFLKLDVITFQMTLSKHKISLKNYKPYQTPFYKSN